MPVKRPAQLLFALILLAAPIAAFALQERTITDEPAVNKPQTTVNQPASQAPAKQPTAPAASQPQTSQPAQSSQVPASTEPSRSYEPAPADKQAQQYTPSGSSGSSGTWTPGGGTEAPPQESGSQEGNIFQMREAHEVQTYTRKEIDEQVMGFFEGGARGLADLVSRAFEKHGQPTGFIKGGEGAGALVVGLRYGEGWLHLKNGKKVYVYWQSPSVGFDLGVNASKVFCLIYNMTDPEQIFQRFPSIDGSAYVVGGFGMNYQQSGKIVLAPIRFGVGLRLGANVGYMSFTRERTINPF